MNEDRKRLDADRSSRGAFIVLGDYYGSLAAARSLGRIGVRIHYADHRRFVPGIWSKYVSVRVRSYQPGLSREFLDFLLNYGEANPGLFLYPCNDDMCWLVANHADELRQNFATWYPSRPVIYSLLNKAELMLVAKNSGIPSPETWLPKTLVELEDIVDCLNFPVLLKPRTQIGNIGKGKGAIVHNREELISKWKALAVEDSYSAEIRAHDANVHFPMIQTYYPEAAEAIISVAGIALTPEDVPCLASSVKIFQRPRKTGVGIAFQALMVDENLADSLRSLVRSTGYFGIFEAEFIVSNGQAMLLDFNPRYYGQMAFEIMRGLLLPNIAYHMAHNEPLKAQALAKDGGVCVSGTVDAKFANSWILRMLTTCQTLAGNMAFADWLGWQRWLKSSRSRRIDSLDEKGDRLPLVVDMVALLIHSLRHPRDFYRKFFSADL